MVARLMNIFDVGRKLCSTPDMIGDKGLEHDCCSDLSHWKRSRIRHLDRRIEHQTGL